jgi:hypothetical protein
VVFRCVSRATGKWEYRSLVGQLSWARSMRRRRALWLRHNCHKAAAPDESPPSLTLDRGGCERPTRASSSRACRSVLCSHHCGRAIPGRSGYRFLLPASALRSCAERYGSLAAGKKKVKGSCVYYTRYLTTGELTGPCSTAKMLSYSTAIPRSNTCSAARTYPWTLQPYHAV